VFNTLIPLSRELWLMIDSAMPSLFMHDQSCPRVHFFWPDPTRPVTLRRPDPSRSSTLRHRPWP